MARMLLALSGLAAGFLFDIRKRKYMTLMMYCVMVLSVLCVIVLRWGRAIPDRSSGRLCDLRIFCRVFYHQFFGARCLYAPAGPLGRHGTGGE